MHLLCAKEIIIPWIPALLYKMRSRPVRNDNSGRCGDGIFFSLGFGALACPDPALRDEEWLNVFGQGGKTFACLSALSG